MRTVYVAHTWASIRRQGGLLVVVGRKGKLSDLRPHELDQLVLMGNVSLSPPALDLLIEKGVDTVFLSSSGRYRARIVHGMSANVRLRMAQYRSLTDPQVALRTARAMVKGKCANARTYLLRVIRRHGGTENLSQASLAIRAAMERADLSHTLDQLRGCEGSAAAAYFRAFDDLLRVEGFRFDGRNRRPPLDPVNALLSFGYTLLSNAVEAAVQVVGLDPYIGALHAPEAGRPSLVCDLVEEFRAPVVDALVVSVLNRRVIHVDDFEGAGPGEPVTIRREALHSFVRLFQARLDARVLYDPAGQKLTYRQIVEQQARHFARYVLGRDDEYRPFTAR